MRIVSRSTLADYWSKHPETKPSLAHWLRMTKDGSWANPQAVSADFSKAKVLNGERIRFEVAGGDYRLVVAYDFPRQAAYIKFIGTHAEYDRIDALSVSIF